MPKTRLSTKNEHEDSDESEEFSDNSPVNEDGLDESPGDEVSSDEDPNFEIDSSLLEADDDDDLYDILSTFFTTDEGDNICTALLGIKDALDTQNKLLMKMAIALTQKK